MLTGRTALITGSTSGIGLATAHVLAKQGCNLVLHGLLTEEEGLQLAEEFSSKYDITTYFDNADLRQASTISALMTRSLSKMKAIDILPAQRRYLCRSQFA